MIVIIAGMFIQFMTELAVILEAFDSFHATVVQAVALTHCYGPSSHLEYGGNRLNNSQNLLIVALVCPSRTRRCLRAPADLSQ